MTMRYHKYYNEKKLYKFLEIKIIEEMHILLNIIAESFLYIQTRLLDLIVYFNKLQE